MPERLGGDRRESLRSRHRLSDGPLAHLVWQAALGAWPIDRDRLQAYAEKAAREAGVSTSWTDPDAAFEDRAGTRLVDALYDDPAVQRWRWPPPSTG